VLQIDGLLPLSYQQLLRGSKADQEGQQWLILCQLVLYVFLFITFEQQPFPAAISYSLEQQPTKRQKPPDLPQNFSFFILH
jgi:hypothetical protein